MCLLVLVVGNPGIQQPVGRYFEAYGTSPAVQWLVGWVFVPGWRLSADGATDWAVLATQDFRAVLLVVLIAVFASRLLTGAPRWRRCLAVGVLASMLPGLGFTGLIALILRGSIEPSSYLGFLRDDLIFGLMVGVLLALLTTGSPGRPAPAARASIPLRKGAGMATLQAPVGNVPGDVTRYLCAAAYIDETFADRVVEDVLADEVSAVAPSPDVDLVAVARHCLAARERRYPRDLRLAGAVGVVALFAPLWLVFVALLVAIVGQANRVRSLATRGQGQPGGDALLRVGFRIGVAVLLAVFVGVSVAALPFLHGVVGWLLGSYLFGVPAVLASVGAALYAYATMVRYDLDTDELLRTGMSREAFARRPPPAVPPREWIPGRLAELKEAQDGNVTVYSGYTPFIGYAKANSNWKLAVPLLPAEASRPAPPEEFTVTELVDHIRDQLGAIAGRGEAALASLVIEDRVFANGTAIGDDDRFSTDTGVIPAARLAPRAVEEIMLRPTGPVRHCLAVHVPLWGGDVVPSVFLHFSTAGETLHLHCSNHVMGPVAADYHVVDRLPDPLTPERRRGLLLGAISRTGTAFFGAPLNALRHARFEARRDRRTLHELVAFEQDPMFDLGARLSIREMALSPTYHNYFQVIDAGRIVAMVERHTFAAIRRFLDSRGFDTTDFRNQQQTILNQGLIQQGGVSIVGNQAIGTGASATQNLAGQPAASE